MFPVPILVAAGLTAAGAVAYQRSKKKKKISEERKRVFERALRVMKEPKQLITLAESFEKEGLRHEARELRKRAAVLDAPKEVKEARKGVFKKALKSKDPVAVKKTADAFHGMGYYDSAKKLRAYARGLAAKLEPGSRVAGEPEFETEGDEFAESEIDFEVEGSIDGVDAVTPDDSVSADAIDAPEEPVETVEVEQVEVEGT